MSDRAAVLNAIRAANGPTQQSSMEIAQASAALIADPVQVQPQFDGVSLPERFIAKATSERVTATVAHVASGQVIPAAVADYLKQHGRRLSVSVQPTEELNQLNWSKFDMIDSLSKDGGAAVTWAEYGIAETGSVVFRSGPDAPVLINFLPLYQIVVLEAAKILAHPEDLWPHLGGASTAQMRLLTLVTGTSGTADIEAKNVRGAHGPRHMHILLVTD